MECWKETNEAGYRYAYADGPYWLSRKGAQIRICWEQHQYRGGASSKGDLEKAGCVLREWRKSGRTVYVCPSNDYIHRALYKDEGCDIWANRVISELKRHTDRPIKLRTKGDAGVSPTNIPGRVKSMEAVFSDAWAIVVAGSVMGVEAICRGVPVFATNDCSALDMGLSDLSRIESPRYPTDDERIPWAENLAARQFGVEELGNGKAYKQLMADLECL